MAVPKQKRSKSRQKRRKYHFKVKNSNLRKCPECKKLIPPHQACPYCGYYKGKKVTKEDNKDNKDKK